MKLRTLVRGFAEGFSTRFRAATALPPVAPPKVPNKQQTLPGYRTQRTASTSAIRRDDKRLANTSLLDFRTGRDTATVVRNLVASSPDISAAVATYLRVGIPEEYTIISRNMDGSINPDTTELAHQLLRRLTYVPDYQLGFNPQSSLQALSESLGKELILYGAMGMELALDKSRLPSQFVPVTTTNIKFYEEDTGVRPVQDIGGTETNLDIPTFFYASIDQDLLNAYSSSYIEAAIQPILADAEFTNDLRRVLKRAVHPRVVATLIEETVKKSLPPDIMNDPEKYAAALNELIAQVESTVNGLEPEDALVSFDSVEYKYLEGQPNALSDTFRSVQELLNAKIATGAKTMPAVMGHSASSTSASAETMLYLKHADIIRRKLNEIYSRALTLAVRLFGQDVYVDFKYAAIDLRPSGELEAYRAMEQARVLELLSLGMITDEQACVELTGHLPPQGYTPLAGTMFKTGASGSAGAAGTENPNSQTSTMGKTDKPAPKSPKSPKAALEVIHGGA